MKQVIAAFSLAVLSLFSTAADADIFRNIMTMPQKLFGEAGKMRVRQMQEDIQIQNHDRALARVMVSRPVDLWNDHVRSAYCSL